MKQGDPAGALITGRKWPQGAGVTGLMRCRSPSHRRSPANTGRCIWPGADARGGLSCVFLARQRLGWAGPECKPPWPTRQRVLDAISRSPQQRRQGTSRSATNQTGQRKTRIAPAQHGGNHAPEFSKFPNYLFQATISVWVKHHNASGSWPQARHAAAMASSSERVAMPYSRDLSAMLECNVRSA